MLSLTDVFLLADHCCIVVSSRDVNKARGVRTKARDMQDQSHRPKAENAKVNFRLNAAVNPYFRF